MMPQGNVVARMRVLRRLYCLGERGHNRAKGPVLGEPMGQPMPADTRQPGRPLAERPRRLRFVFASRLGVAALARD